ncbi:ABC transporter ATP-binding protein [Terrilactibacillus laevilacticus]|uniref:ABC transporter ATP-binding protein n=1 Tax=Terrilactibacillus laevilacticus TaxID=1380157 RepID=UPI001146A899|nr:ABC transporter ATP-binding protein [Terrilactibacillus laevilacticus]
MSQTDILLQVENLKAGFKNDKEIVPAVNDVSFTVKKGETIGLVGESGCGKSVTSLSIMGLLKHNSGKILDGKINFNGKDLLSLSEKEMRDIRGNIISMVFQEPMTSLNPVFKVGIQIQEAIECHQKISKKQAKQLSIDILKQVGIPRAERIVNEYPHQLSGGMRQRVMIAMGMVCQPELLIADEPTTALDVTIQAQILELMKDLKQKNQTSIILITHDLGVVAEMCDRVMVMYSGKIVEEADVYTLFQNPKHPYTKGLLASTPKIRQHTNRLGSIPGSVPSLNEKMDGCRFAPRCPFVMKKCKVQMPDLISVEDGSSCRCWLHESERMGVATS